jgi:hypothetical protein
MILLRVLPTGPLVCSLWMLDPSALELRLSKQLPCHSLAYLSLHANASNK